MYFALFRLGVEAGAFLVVNMAPGVHPNLTAPTTRRGCGIGLRNGDIACIPAIGSRGGTALRLKEIRQRVGWRHRGNG